MAALTPTPLAAQDAGRVAGRVVDRTSGAPVADAVVRVEGRAPVVTDDEGRFLVEGIFPGEVQVTFEHIAYGAHLRTVTVAVDRTSVLSVAIDRQAIELDAVLVETLSELEERRVRSGFSINEIGPDRIDLAARSGENLAQLIQSALPGVDTRAGLGAGVCVTYRAIRSGNNRGRCDGVEVRIDGVPINDPSTIYTTMPLADIQRVEVLSPAQAGARYGMRSGQGVLLIETKTGRDRIESDLSRYITGWGWEGESEPYPWFKVLGASALTTAATVALSTSFADSCFFTPEDKPLALRTECDGLRTFGASVGSVVLPAVAGGLVARWAGGTERSRGRLVPSLVASSFTLIGGYLLLLSGDGGTETAGAVVLFAGVPLTLALSDRVLRILR